MEPLCMEPLCMEPLCLPDRTCRKRRNLPPCSCSAVGDSMGLVQQGWVGQSRGKMPPHGYQ